MIKRTIWICIIVLLISGCITSVETIQDQDEKGAVTIKEDKEIEIAPGKKKELLKKAKTYLKNRDYSNALINIIRAEKAEGKQALDQELDHEIREFKNNLIEKLNTRAIYEKKVLILAKG